MQNKLDFSIKAARGYCLSGYFYQHVLDQATPPRTKQVSHRSRRINAKRKKDVPHELSHLTLKKNDE